MNKKHLYRVLIVDDASTVREALRWIIEDTTDLIPVGEAADGRQALARAAELMPDVVILDVELPDLDGYTVSRALKASSRPPAVVFLTVHGDADSRRRAMHAGGDGFAEKGKGWPYLIEQIRHALSR